MSKIIDQIVDKAREYRAREKWVDHSDYCDYMHRSPARYDDCDCGAFRSQEGQLTELAEELVELILG